MKENECKRTIRLRTGILILALTVPMMVYYIVAAKQLGTSAFGILLIFIAASGVAKLLMGDKFKSELLFRIWFWLFIEFFVRAAVYGRYEFFEYTILEADDRRREYYFANKVNLIPFKSISLFFSLSFTSIFTNILGNIGLIIPVSFFSPLAYKTKKPLLLAFLSGVGLSVFVECSQLFFMCGAFDIDDLILNSTGALLGTVAFAIINKIKKNRIFLHKFQ